MKYRLVERENPAKPAEPKKWYTHPVNVGKFTIKDFAKENRRPSWHLLHADGESARDNDLKIES
jgi:hypothetical protein